MGSTMDNNTDPTGYVRPPLRRRAHLTLTEKQVEKQKKAQSGIATGAAFIDIEKLKGEVTPEAMVGFKKNLQAFLQRQANRNIYSAVAVGSIPFFLDGKKNERWVGIVKMNIITPRNAHAKIEHLIFSHVREHGTLCTIVLITGDMIFIRFIRILQSLGVFVILIKPRQFDWEISGVADMEYNLSQITPYETRLV